MSLINPAVLANQDELARQFREAEPFQHVVIPDFLQPELCERLLADFPGFEERHALNEMGQVGGKATRPDVRDISDSYRALDAYIQTDGFLALVSKITGIPDLLYDPDYIGGGTHENRHGQSLDVHVDFNYHPRTRWHRRLNLIIYLNKEWQDDWGGNLELHGIPWNERDRRVRAIAPAFNCCALFETTESSWHGFSQIGLPEERKQQSRKSFAIYLYTRERPVESTAPPHATIYVPASIATDWQAGRVLDESDLAELRQGLTRMRTQLRFLYDRETRFAAQIDALEQALAESRAALTLEIQGHAVHTAGTTGLWQDGWAGAELTASFKTTRAARTMTLEVWSPPQLDGAQTLRIELGDHVHSERLSGGRRTSIRLPLTAPVGTESTLRIQAERTWTPSADGNSGDERPLAYRILSTVLD